MTWALPRTEISPLHGIRLRGEKLQSKFLESVLFSAEHGKVYYFLASSASSSTLCFHTLSESAWGSYLLIEGTVFVYASQQKSIFLFKASAWAWESSFKYRDEIFTKFETQTSWKKQADLTASILSAQLGRKSSNLSVSVASSHILSVPFYKGVKCNHSFALCIMCCQCPTPSLSLSLPPLYLYSLSAGQIVSQISGFWTSRTVKVSFLYIYIF